MEEKQAKFELVLTAGQVLKVQILICALLCLVSATSYLVGLSNTKVEAASPARMAPVKPAEAKPIEIEPAVSISPNPAPEPVVRKDEPKPTDPTPKTPDVKPPEQSAAVAPRLPIQGKTYFQMAAVERGIAEVFVEYLTRKGFASLLAPGPNDSVFRVLVGPIEAENFTRTQEALTAAGFTTFARRFKQAETPQAVSKPDSE